MKKIISAGICRLLLLAATATGTLALTACSKDTEAQAPAQDFSAADEAIIQKYVAANQLSRAQRQASGLYYVPVVTNPNGLQATAGRKASVVYTGTLLDGTVFDATSQHGNVPFTFTVGGGQVIKGWDEGIALMRKSEKGILLIPSGLAYGNTGSSSIPPNTVLRFDIEIADVR